MPRTLGHAPRAAAGAKPTPLAEKRQQPLRMALLAHHAQEAVLEHAAAQERLELLAHIRGQRAVLRRKTRKESQPQDLADPLPRRVCGMQGQGTLAFLSSFARRLGVDRSARLLSAPGGPAGQAATVVLRTQG